MLGNSRSLIGQVETLALEHRCTSPVETEIHWVLPGANCLFWQAQWGLPGEDRRWVVLLRWRNDAACII